MNYNPYFFCFLNFSQLNDILQCKNAIDHFVGKDEVFKVFQEKWSVIEDAVRVLKMFFVTTKADI